MEELKTVYNVHRNELWSIQMSQGRVDVILPVHPSQRSVKILVTLGFYDTQDCEGTMELPDNWSW